ncbi:hypothetical protein DUI87_31565 [Hirundo rustica rustica]|uniref:Uncharacterized protein n=1 Tax=Hirundo rustica rustica TaxID=333673 RepID=A0A3M0JBJ3_HIRRU|nr:hypothetical protein DUI87_31565 [Hirundo rustica rustica]
MFSSLLWRTLISLLRVYPKNPVALRLAGQEKRDIIRGFYGNISGGKGCDVFSKAGVIPGVQDTSLDEKVTHMGPPITIETVKQTDL